MTFIFLTQQFYDDYANCAQIETKITRPYVKIHDKINGVQFAVPLRSEINHHDHVLWTDKANRCGLDFSKAVVIENDDYVDNAKKVYIRKIEFESLRGKKHDVKSKMIKHISDYKHAKTMTHINRYKCLCQFSTLQYFENHIGLLFSFS
jgi:protein AbiQ